MKLRALIIAAAAFVAMGCTSTTWTAAEKQIIASQGEEMKVLSIFDREDSLVLRRQCSDLTREDLESSLYQDLARKMLATVTSPSQDGVGIAAPQVGVSRRVVAVLRYDKPDQPFEVFPNIRVSAHYGDQFPGPEGCLSVPGKRGDVMRWRSIDISYTSPVSHRDTTEHVEGYTAIIFQHECDHLDGYLYTDKAENVRDRE